MRYYILLVGCSHSIPATCWGRPAIVVCHLEATNHLPVHLTFHPSPGARGQAGNVTNIPAPIGVLKVLNVAIAACLVSEGDPSAVTVARGTIVVTTKINISGLDVVCEEGLGAATATLCLNGSAVLVELTLQRSLAIMGALASICVLLARQDRIVVLGEGVLKPALCQAGQLSVGLCTIHLGVVHTENNSWVHLFAITVLLGTHGVRTNSAVVQKIGCAGGLVAFFEAQLTAR